MDPTSAGNATVASHTVGEGLSILLAGAIVQRSLHLGGTPGLREMALG